MDDSWLNMEVTKDGELLFINVVLGKAEKTDEKMECLTQVKEYKEWMERHGGKRKLRSRSTYCGRKGGPSS